MKLNKKHIGQLFDVNGSDGSWYYQLVDIKGDRLLFFCNDRYEIDTNKYADWRPFKSRFFSKKDVRNGWKTGRVAQ